MKTLEITNFSARLTRNVNGDINSGFAKYLTTNSVDAFTYPQSLTWNEIPIQIDPTGSVITDLVVAGKSRVESGVIYNYCVGHTGRVYKIQVNDPVTYNPNYDNPVLLASLTSNSPTFTRGGSLDFFGDTERIYIGHDKGVTRIDTDGTNETFVGVLGSWTQNVPRPSQQFLGKLYFGNGSNIAEIDSTAAVTSYTKLSPGYPLTCQVRDIDISPDGIYLESVVSTLALADITSVAPDTGSTVNTDSYVFKWNGTDTGYTTYNSFNSFALTANTTYGNRQYVWGTDIAGASVFNPTEKILTPILSQAPLPNAANSNGNIVGWMVPEFSTLTGTLRASEFLYGPLDQDYSNDSWYRIFQMSATSPETDIIRVPYQSLISNFGLGTVWSGYAGGAYSSAKTYFSTLEASPVPTTKYRFYKFLNVASGFVPPISGIYETQNQLFSHKISPHEVRIYTRPLIAGNEFTIDLIGSNGSPITNGSKTFTVGTNIDAGEDRFWFNPAIEPTYTLGIRITNSGSTNWTCVKVEIDHDHGGD